MTGRVLCTLSHKTCWRKWVFWRAAMNLSRESDSGLRGLAMLARRPSGQMPMFADIAQAEDLPHGLLSTILPRAARETRRAAAAAREKG